MSERSTKIVQIAFSGLEMGRVPGSESDLRLVLKTVDEGPRREYLLPVPPSLDAECTGIIRLYLSGRDQIRSADSFFRNVQDAVGCHVSRIVIRGDGEGGHPRAEVKAVAEEGDISFDVQVSEGVLHATFNSLPLLIEESLLVPSHRHNEEEWEGTMRRLSPEAEYELLSHYLRQGRMPEDYEADRLVASFDTISKAHARDLLHQAIEAEQYEWAEWISNYLEREEP